jgi:hypothetical protein
LLSHRTMRRYDSPFCGEYDHIYPSGLDPSEYETGRRSKYVRRNTPGLCFVRPHERERSSSRLVRFAEFLSGRGPHFVICTPGSRPRPEDWAYICSDYSRKSTKTKHRGKQMNQRTILGYSGKDHRQNSSIGRQGRRVRFADEEAVYYLPEEHTSYPYDHGHWCYH